MEKKDINNKIDETLSSLEGMQKAVPAGLFYEKVMLRLEKKEAQVVSLAPRVIWQAAACIAFLVALNIVVCVRSFKKEDRVQVQRNPVTEEYFSYLKTPQF